MIPPCSWLRRIRLLRCGREQPCETLADSRIRRAKDRRSGRRVCRRRYVGHDRGPIGINDDRFGFSSFGVDPDFGKLRPGSMDLIRRWPRQHGIGSKKDRE